MGESIVSGTDLLLQLIDVLNDLGVQYMIVGSYSSNFWGRGRMTKDADLVIEAESDFVAKLGPRLPQGFVLDSQMTFETITFTSKYLIVHQATLFKFELFLVGTDEFDRSRFARRIKVDFDGHPTFMPCAEDVVVQKLRWAGAPRRGKDIDDVRFVLAVQMDRLDLPWIRHWCQKHGSLERFEQVLREATELRAARDSL